MKRYFAGLAIFLAIIIFLPSTGLSGKWWILGTVKGKKSRDKVITLRLVRLERDGVTFITETSVNKYGQYAFSDPGEGLPPSAYKLILFVGYDKVMDIGLDGVRPGGRVPPVTITW